MKKVLTLASILLLLELLCVGVLGVFSYSYEETIIIPYVSIASEIAVDGSLTELAWNQANHLHHKLDYESGILDIDVYLMYDDTFLYMMTNVHNDDFFDIESSRGLGDWLELEINDRNDFKWGGNSGNDVKSIDVTLTGDGHYFDAFLAIKHADTVLDRTDGEGVFSFSGPRQIGALGDYWFELKMPLNSGEYSVNENQPADANLREGVWFGIMIGFCDYDPVKRVGNGASLYVGCILEEPLGLPDLTFQMVGFDKPEPFEGGDAIQFGATLVNQGVGNAYNFSVEVYLDDWLYTGETISLAAGQSETLWCDAPWKATQGTHTITWVADSTNAVAESNESNNRMTRTFTVGLPTPQYGSLKGRATDASIGNPIKGASVSVSGPVSQTQMTGSDGEFGFVLPAGTYTVTVSASGYQSQTRNGTVSTDSTLWLNFELQPSIIMYSSLTPYIAFGLVAFAGAVVAYAVLGRKLRAKAKRVEIPPQTLDDQVYNYVADHGGIVSIPKMSQELGTTMQELDASFERLTATGKLERTENVASLSPEPSTDKEYVAIARALVRLEELRSLKEIDEETYQKLKEEYEERLRRLR